jgi:hypothetical protein
MATHPTGEHIAVGAHRLWVEREGSGSHEVFHPAFTELARSHEVIYVDLYDRGRSDAPASLSQIREWLGVPPRS